MVESRLRQEARSRNATIESILFRLVSAGGKRLRPALVLLCGGYGGVDQKGLCRWPLLWRWSTWPRWYTMT